MSFHHPAKLDSVTGKARERSRANSFQFKTLMPKPFVYNTLDLKYPSKLIKINTLPCFTRGRVSSGYALPVAVTDSTRHLKRIRGEQRSNRFGLQYPMPVTSEALEIPVSLAWAHPVTAEWFLRRFGSPTEPQEEGWPNILAGNATLISAPTGSGKTLAAFLVCIDKLLRDAIAGNLAPATQVVYVSPLKALSNDVQKNLRSAAA